MERIEQCITRTMFCPNCNAHGRPKKGDVFVVYGSTRQNFFVRKCHQDGVRGYTPHLICYFEPFKVEHGYIDTLVHCGVCGVEVRPQQNDIHPLVFGEGTLIKMPEKELLSLILLWKNTGMEII